MVEILRSWFKSFGTFNELIIIHPPHIKTSDLAQQILDQQDEIIKLKADLRLGRAERSEASIPTQ